MRQEFFKNTKRIVLKIGTSALTTDGSFDPLRIKAIVKDIIKVNRIRPNINWLIVSSGAISAGMRHLNKKKRVSDIAKLQALAAIGQPKVMQYFCKAFEAADMSCAQILLTWDDLANRARYENTKKTIEALTYDKVFPIINENDTVSTKEIEFGDNDQLSVMVATLFNADTIIYLTDSDGFYADFELGAKTRLSMVDDLGHNLFSAIKDKINHHTKGGMTSKLDAIKKSLKAGIPCLLASGQKPKILEKLISGYDTGTLFLPTLKKLTSKKHWIRYTSKTVGTLFIDEGAEQALMNGGKSLLSKGVNMIKGHFEAGASVGVKNSKGELIGKGIINFTSSEIEKIMGLRSDEWSSVLGRPCLDEILHRDNFVKEENFES